MNVVPFQVTYHPRARKQLDGIEPRKIRDQLTRRIDALANNPPPNGAKALSQPRGTPRLRQDQHCIVNKLRESQIVILRLGDRKDVYR